MLKISESRQVEQTVTLRLEGRIVGPWVAELQQVCQQMLDKNRGLALDLAEIVFLDEAGINLLARLRSRGTELLNLTPFVAEQLRSVETIKVADQAARF